MTATLLDGKALAEQIRSEVAQETAQFIAQTGVTPCLAAVLVGDNPASQVYVRNKQTACQKAGVGSQLHRLGAETTTDELLALIDRLNADPAVHGILVQLPLPKAVKESRGFWTPSIRQGRQRVPSGERGPDRAGPAAVPALHAARRSAIAASEPDRHGRRECCGAGPKRHRRQADGHHAHAAERRRRRHGDRLPQPHARFAQRHARRPTF